MVGRNLHYDAMAEEYAAHRRVHPVVLDGLLDGGAVDAASRVLEVGVGSGNYAAAIRGVAGCAISGIDPSEAMLDRARALDGALDLWPGRAEKLPFADHAFDLVYSVDVVHHVADRAAFFREAFRVLVPGGRLCTVTDSPADIRRRVPLSSHWPETVAVEFARYPLVDTLAAEMEIAGFAGFVEDHAEFAYPLTDASPWRDLAFSSLHLIDVVAFVQGLDRLEADLSAGPLQALSLYTLLWGDKPPGCARRKGGSGDPSRFSQPTRERKDAGSYPPTQNAWSTASCWRRHKGIRTND